MRLNTDKPDCQWCLWEIVGKNWKGNPVYFPKDYCGHHGKDSQNNTYYVFDDDQDDRVFLSYESMYDYCVNNQYIYKDSDGVIFDTDYQDLNQEQKEYIHYRLLVQS